MTASDAKAYLDQGIGEPATAYISPDDMKAAIDVIYADIDGIVVTKADVGLSDVDNTSDADKPISDATQAALDTKEPIRVLYWSGGSWPTRPDLPSEQVEWRSVLEPDAPPPPSAEPGDSWKRAPAAGES